MSSIHFTMKETRAQDKIEFDGVCISEQELKNLIAAKKRLDTTRDHYVLLNPEDKKPFPPNHTYVRDMSVVVVRQPLPAGLVARARQQARDAAAAAARAENSAADQAYETIKAISSAAEAAKAAAAADPNAQYPDTKALYDMEAQLIAGREQAVWQSQTHEAILRQQQQQGRGARRGLGRQPPFCCFCGTYSPDHSPIECPNKHEPRNNLRHVRAPTGIPSSFLNPDKGGGLLLSTGQTAAVATNAADTAKFLAAFPNAKKLQALAKKGA